MAAKPKSNVKSKPEEGPKPRFSKNFSYLAQRMWFGVLIEMLCKGRIDRSRLHDENYVMDTMSQLLPEGSAVIQMHDDFFKRSQVEFEAGREEIAIVLLATGFEHLVNHFYQDCLALKFTALTRTETTEMIRSINIKPKLTWLYKVVTDSQLDDELRIMVLRVTELRNCIAHYKAVPHLLDDTDGGSHANTKEQLQALDPVELYQLPARLEEALSKASCVLSGVDPDDIKKEMSWFDFMPEPSGYARAARRSERVSARRTSRPSSTSGSMDGGEL